MNSKLNNLWIPSQYVAIIHLVSSHALPNSVLAFYTCRLCCCCNPAFIGLVWRVCPSPETSNGLNQSPVIKPACGHYFPGRHMLASEALQKKTALMDPATVNRPAFALHTPPM